MRAEAPSAAAQDGHSKDHAKSQLGQLRGTWVLALVLLSLLLGMRFWLRTPAEDIFAGEVPVSVRGAPHGGAEQLARRYLYTEPFELERSGRLDFSLERSAADGILAVTVDLVPERGPSTRGLELFAAERMSVHGLRGESKVKGSLRGAPPGRYRLRAAGTWVGQPGEARVPSATLRVASQVGSPAAFWWAALLLLSPALFGTLRTLWRARSTATGTSSAADSGDPAFIDTNSDTLSPLMPEGSHP